KLILVDDHLLFADAVRFLLQSSDADIETQVFSSLASAVEFLSTGAPVDLALIDYAMPHVGGIEALAAIAEARPGLPIAFLSGLDDPQLVAEALQRGALGWLSKAMAGHTLISAL